MKLRTGFKAAATLVAILAFFPLSSASPQAPGAEASRAILVRGTIAVRGVPHFPANAIPAFYGEYRWGESRVNAWVVRDELYISKAWSEYPIRSPQGLALRAYKQEAPPGAPGIAVYAIRMDGNWAVIEMDASIENPRAFLLAFISRLDYFAARSTSPSDLSLPAVLEIK